MFGCFKEVLAEYPDELERWFGYKDACLKEQLREWLEMEEIEPTNEPGTRMAPK